MDDATNDLSAQPDAAAAGKRGGKKRLGRGLSALIAQRAASVAGPGEATEAVAAVPGGAAAPVGVAGGASLRELPVDDIAPATRQPRRSFDPDELAELAASIRTLGVVQPIVVRPAATGGQAPWELIAGERRLRAARLAGLAAVPALVRPADEAASLEIALAENVAREDLNPIEEALAFAALADEFGLTHERIGELVGRSRVSVTNVLRLLELPDEVRAMIERSELSEGHGRALLGLPDHLERRRAALLVVAKGLTVRQTEALVRAAGAAGSAPAAPAARTDPELDDLVDELYGLLEVPVRIKTGKRGGKVELRFRDHDELERLVALLRGLK